MGFIGTTDTYIAYSHNKIGLQHQINQLKKLCNNPQHPSYSVLTQLIR